MLKIHRQLFVAAATVFAAAMVGAALAQLRAANASSLESTALIAADSYVQTLEAVRSLYTSEVVGRLADQAVTVTHDYEDIDHAIPLPATFTIGLAEALGREVEGLGVKLYSEHPFPWRANRPLDEFELAALEYLTTNPDSTFHEVQEEAEEPRLRFARGDAMREECVTCHNTHPDTPKNDWQVGDLRGVLSITLPLDSFREAAAEARRPYTALLFLALLGLLAAVVMVVELLPLGRDESPGPSRKQDDDT